MKDAIQKAIEGEYKYKGDSLFYDDDYGHFYVSDGDGGYVAIDSEILLDPLFWQCLGKQQGWEMWKSPEINASVIEEDYWGESTPLWKYHWHRFINHIAEGGTEDEFFISLLK